MHHSHWDCCVACESERVLRVKHLPCTKEASPALCASQTESKKVGLAQVDSWRKVRRRLGLPMRVRGPASREAAAMAQAVTRAQLQEFVELCRRRYEAKRIDPGPQAKGCQGLECSPCTLGVMHSPGCMANSAIRRQCCQSVTYLPQCRLIGPFQRGTAKLCSRKDPCSVLRL